MDWPHVHRAASGTPVITVARHTVVPTEAWVIVIVAVPRLVVAVPRLGIAVAWFKVTQDDFSGPQNNVPLGLLTVTSPDELTSVSERLGRCRSGAWRSLTLDGHKLDGVSNF